MLQTVLSNKSGLDSESGALNSSLIDESLTTNVPQLSLPVYTANTYIEQNGGNLNLKNKTNNRNLTGNLNPDGKISMK